MIVASAFGCAPDLIGVPKGSLEVVLHHGHFPPAPIASAILRYVAVLQGVPCRAGDVAFSREGRLKYAVLSRDFTLGGHALPAGTQLEFLTDDLGHITRESFMADPPGAFSILGRTFPQGSKLGFLFGLLDRVKLGAELELDGQRYPAGGWVHFDKSGRVSRVD
jgi:hypothetical protein